MWSFIAEKNRGDLNLLIHALLGHNLLNSHSAKRTPGHDPHCRFCGMEIEMTSHLMYECDEFLLERLEPPTGDRDLTMLQLSKIMGYLKTFLRLLYDPGGLLGTKDPSHPDTATAN